MKTRYEGLKAKLVWDGTDEVRIPEEAGEPREDQMQGTAPERLGEVAGRNCYDSMGKNGSRSSADYHPHITGVGHGSVYGHWHGVFEFAAKHLSVEARFAILKALVNRPGIYVNLKNPDVVRFTTNFRSIFDWGKWTNEAYKKSYYDAETALAARTLHVALCCVGRGLAPQIIAAFAKVGKIDEGVIWNRGDGMFDFMSSAKVVEPEDDFERWISIYVEGSRGLTHEEVRHGYMTGISQRSTRFVDENESPWITHPMLQEYLVDENVPLEEREEVRLRIAETEMIGKKVYGTVVEKLQPWAMKRIPETDKFRKQTARKQARGAARGYLGNGLKTLGIFSASAYEWNWKETQRAANAADGEIRCEYSMEILPELLKSRYAKTDFAHLKTEPAVDGVGLVLAGGGNK